MGYTNAVSLNRLIKEASDGDFDAVIHAGGTGNYSAYHLSTLFCYCSF